VKVLEEQSGEEEDELINIEPSSEEVVPEEPEDLGIDWETEVE